MIPQEETWVFDLPLTDEGKAALAILKKGLNKNYRIRVRYRGPTSSIFTLSPTTGTPQRKGGDIPRKHATHMKVWLEHKYLELREGDYMRTFKKMRNRK